MPGPYPLSTLSVTIDDAGITGPTYEDILASLEASYRQIYGSDINLAADAQDGQWLAIQAQAMYDNNQALIAGYLAYSPTTAQGAGLSSVVKINGIQRLPVSNSTVEMHLIGAAGTVIENGAVTDIHGQAWLLPRPHVIIPAQGEVYTTAVAELPGAIQAAPNTINAIATPTPGWDTANNPSAAFPGLPIETDAKLRRRQTFSTSLPAITPRESIAAAVANVPNVGRIAVRDNDTHHYDDEMVPPHSIAVVVEGGRSQDIARAIALKKNTGCGTYGTFQVVVHDSHGVPCPINFFYLLEIQIYVTVQLDPLIGYLDAIGSMIVDTIVLFIQNFGIGEDVYASRLAAPANLSGDEAMEVTGLNQLQLDRLSHTYIIRSINIGLTSSPETSADIVIPYNCAAYCQRGNVMILVNPGT